MYKRVLILLICSILFFVKSANAELTNQLPNDSSLQETNQISVWSNVMYNTTGYNEFNSVALLLAFIGNTLLLGNSNLPGVSGARNVWQLNGHMWTNLSNGWIDYHRSAPSVLLPLSSLEIIIGHFDGSVQDCSMVVCNYLVLNQQELGFGVTSLLHINHNYFVGYTDVNLGNKGQLLVYQEVPPGAKPQQFNVPGIHSGVGKITTDNNYVYAPTMADGVLKISLDGIDTTSITPITLQNKEFVTVMYYASNNNVLYAGTSLANVYKVKLPINNGSDWVKLTTNSLSSKAYISAITVDSLNNLYVGLANLFGPVEGGSLYTLKNGESNFTKDVGYSDTSSINTMLFNNHVYIATFAGNIWQN